MKKHWQYLKYVIRHKWHTLKAARKLGITWLGVVHDWTKFLPSEWLAYVDTFYGGPYPTDEEADEQERTGMRVTQVSYRPRSQGDVKRAFDRAWLHHQKSNRHHWQYWLLKTDEPENQFRLDTIQIDPTIDLMEGNERTGLSIGISLYERRQHACVDRLVAQLNRSPVALPMPDKYRKEMLADWRGAGLAISGKDNTLEWYSKNKANIILHSETRDWIEGQLGLCRETVPQAAIKEKS